MDVKQEVSEEKCKIEIYYNEVDDALLNSLKSEIKEEPNRENTFDDVALNEFSLKTEIEQDAGKLMPVEENIKNEKGFLQEDDTRQIMKIPVNSNDKKQHMSQHAQKKTIQCEICFKQFSEIGSLKKHLRMHPGEKPKCEICFKQFTRKSYLNIHMRVHTGEKLYNCEICFKPFIQASDLKTHLRVHTGEKPYKCEICIKQFTSATNLKTHLRVHRGEKPHKC